MQRLYVSRRFTTRRDKVPSEDDRATFNQLVVIDQNFNFALTPAFDAAITTAEGKADAVRAMRQQQRQAARQQAQAQARPAGN